MRGSPQEVAAEIRRRAAALPRAIRAAEMETIKAVQDTAKQFSRGGYSTLALTRMGHPYAKRRPRPPADPGIINYQTGNFYRGWRRRTGGWSGGTLFSYVFNVSREGQLLQAGGTGRSAMMERNILRLVVPTIRRARIARLSRAIRKVL